MREMFRPVVQNDQEPRQESGASSAAAASLEQLFLSHSPEAAREWEREPEHLPASPDLPAMPRTAPQVSVAELIDEYGGTRGLADAVGISQRQVERWQAGSASPNRARPATRAAFAAAHDTVAHQRLAADRRAVRAERKALRAEQRAERRETGQQEWGPVVDRLGGVEATARTLGCSTRTVERWMAGDAHPNLRSRQQLEAADRKQRLRGAYGITYYPTEGEEEEPPPERRKPAAPGTRPSVGVPGEPQGSIYVRASGHVAVEGYYRYARQVGVQGLGPDGMHELPPEVAQEMQDKVANGDADGALQVLEEHLSTGYAECDTYDPDSDAGWHFETLDELELVQMGAVD